MRPLIIALLLAGCAVPGEEPPVTIQPVTLADVYILATIAGVDTAALIDPAQMTMREKRIMAGVCLASDRVSTRFDEEAAALCGPLMAGFVPPPES